VGDALQGIHNGTCKVVGGVHFEARPRVVMGGGVAAVDDWITKSFVFVFERDFGSDTMSATLLYLDFSKPGRGGGVLLQCTSSFLQRYEDCRQDGGRAIYSQSRPYVPFSSYH
jgi:hypothetical protein